MNLKDLYEQETGKSAEMYLQAYAGAPREWGGYSDEYVQWLEAKLQTQEVNMLNCMHCARSFDENNAGCICPTCFIDNTKDVKLEDGEYNGWHCFKCGQQGIPGTHVTFDEKHEGCGGDCH